MKLFGLAMALVGTALIVTGARMFWRRLAARLRGGLLEGEIVKWRCIRIRGHSGSLEIAQLYRSVVKFVDSAGIEHTLQLDYQYTAKYRDEHPPGSSHAVLHDPKFPNCAYDNSFTQAYFLPSLLVSAGSLVLLIGLGVFFGSQTEPEGAS